MSIWTMILALVLSCPLHAQEKKDEQGFHAGFFVGPYLPSGIVGVWETMKVIGGRAAFGNDTFRFESSAFHSSEDGASINYLTGGLSIHLSHPGIDFLSVVIDAGAQAVRYRRAPNRQGRSFSYANSGGIYVGGGFMSNIAKNWDARVQYTIFNGPGRTVLIEFGLEYRFGEDSKKDSTNQL